MTNILSLLAAEESNNSSINVEINVPADPIIGLTPGTMAKVFNATGKAASLPTYVSGIGSWPLIPGLRNDLLSVPNGGFTTWTSKLLDSGNTLVIHSNPTSTTNYTLVAQVVDPNGNWGTGLNFGISLTTDINLPIGLGDQKIIRLDATHYLFTYLETETTRALKAVVFTVTGTTVTAGTIVSLAPTSGGISSDWSITELVASTKYLVTFSNVTGRAVAFSVSGSTITLGTEIVVDSSANAGMNCAACGTDKAIAAYFIGANGYAIVITASGLTLSIGTKLTTTSSGTGSRIFMYKVATDKVFYCVESNPFNGFLTASGTTLTNNTAGVANFSQAGTAEWRYYTTVGNVIYLIRFGLSGTNYNYPTSIKLAALDSVALTGTSPGSPLGPSTSIPGGYAYDAAANRIYTVGPAGNDSSNAYNTMGIYQTNTTGFTTIVDGQLVPNNSALSISIYNKSVIVNGSASYETLYLYPSSLIPLGNNKLLFNALKINTQAVDKAYKKFYGVVDATAFTATAVAGESLLGVVQSSGNILLRGIADGFTGLTAGKFYFYSAVTGEFISQTSSGAPTGFTLLGKALSTTSILVKDYLW
jgi:hypothetical protein